MNPTSSKEVGFIILSRGFWILDFGFWIEEIIHSPSYPPNTVFVKLIFAVIPVHVRVGVASASAEASRREG
jgi:hypothetical protein